ncbi:uncharacterized protein LODBEIA_P51570 [Lodderomyces beijingensis]|uniref:RRN6 beta-propeller domain-containing protein n=1 Tax=Lodderomyces beijingensis TaxID=1775926 RepID=A0ABP0ZS05_9ASCO
MWPHKHGRGIQLSYGVYGNAMVRLRKEGEAEKEGEAGDGKDVHEPPNEGWSFEATFPRRENSKPAFAVEKGTVKEIVAPSVSADETNSFVISKIRRFLLSHYIPQRTLASLSSEAQVLDSDMVYDPEVGALMKIFGLQIGEHSGRSIDVLAFAKSDIPSILCFSRMSKESGSFRARDHVEIDLLDTIRQIEVSQWLKKKNGDEEKKKIILVRTSLKVFVLTCQYAEPRLGGQGQGQGHPKLELSVLEEIVQDSGTEHVSFCRQDYSRFVLLGSNGTMTMWHIERKKLKKVTRSKKVKLSLSNLDFDLDELTKWTRLYWPKKEKVILVVTNTTISRVSSDCEEAQSELLLTANTWSRIRDFDCKGDEAFLLTSRELVWLKYEKGLRRVLSWRHFLNGSDPSLKMSILEKQQTYYIFLHSELSPLILAYTFGYENGLPCILRDPYIIRLGPKPTKQLSLAWNQEDENQKMTILSMAKDRSIASATLATAALSHEIKQKIASSAQPLPGEYDRMAPKTRNLKKIFNWVISSELSRRQIAPDLPMFRQRLESSLRHLPGTTSVCYQSIYDAVNLGSHMPVNAKSMRDLDEAMREINHFGRDDIRSVNFGAYSGGRKDISDATLHNKVQHLIKSLSSSYYPQNSVESIENTAVMLASSSLKYTAPNPDLLKNRLQSLKNKSPAAVQSLLNSWDKGSPDEKVSPLRKRARTRGDLVDGTPSSRATQTTQVKESSPSLQPSFTQSSQATNFSPPSSSQPRGASSQMDDVLLSQSRVRTSQTASQGGSQRRKKKKKGGF